MSDNKVTPFNPSHGSRPQRGASEGAAVPRPALPKPSLLPAGGFIKTQQDKSPTDTKSVSAFNPQVKDAAPFRGAEPALLEALQKSDAPGELIQSFVLAQTRGPGMPVNELAWGRAIDHITTIGAEQTPEWTAKACNGMVRALASEPIDYRLLYLTTVCDSVAQRVATLQAVTAAAIVAGACKEAEVEREPAQVIEQFKKLLTSAKEAAQEMPYEHAQAMLPARMGAIAAGLLAQYSPEQRREQFFTQFSAVINEVFPPAPQDPKLVHKLAFSFLTDASGEKSMEVESLVRRALKGRIAGGAVQMEEAIGPAAKRGSVTGSSTEPGATGGGLEEPHRDSAPSVTTRRQPPDTKGATAFTPQFAVAGGETQADHNPQLQAAVGTPEPQQVNPFAGALRIILKTNPDATAREIADGLQTTVRSMLSSGIGAAQIALALFAEIELQCPVSPPDGKQSRGPSVASRATQGAFLAVAPFTPKMETVLLPALSQSGRPDQVIAAWVHTKPVIAAGMDSRAPFESWAKAKKEDFAAIDGRTWAQSIGYIAATAKTANKPAEWASLAYGGVSGALTAQHDTAGSGRGIKATGLVGRTAPTRDPFTRDWIALALSVAANVRSLSAVRIEEILSAGIKQYANVGDPRNAKTVVEEFKGLLKQALAGAKGMPYDEAIAVLPARLGSMAAALLESLPANQRGSFIALLIEELDLAFPKPIEAAGDNSSTGASAAVLAPVFGFEGSLAVETDIRRAIRGRMLGGRIGKEAEFSAPVVAGSSATSTPKLAEQLSSSADPATVVGAYVTQRGGSGILGTVLDTIVRGLVEIGLRGGRTAAWFERTAEALLTAHLGADTSPKTQAQLRAEIAATEHDRSMGGVAISTLAESPAPVPPPKLEVIFAAMAAKLETLQPSQIAAMFHGFGAALGVSPNVDLQVKGWTGALVAVLTKGGVDRSKAAAALIGFKQGLRDTCAPMHQAEVTKSLQKGLTDGLEAYVRAQKNSDASKRWNTLQQFVTSEIMPEDALGDGKASSSSSSSSRTTSSPSKS